MAIVQANENLGEGGRLTVADVKPYIDSGKYTVKEEPTMNEKKNGTTGEPPTPRPIKDGTGNTSYNKPTTISPLDENQVREEELKKQQARIDAINQLYVEEYRRANERAYGREGSQRSMSAARGILGSDFAEQDMKQVKDIQAAEQREIDARKNAEIQAVYGLVDKDVKDRIALNKAEIAEKEKLFQAQQEAADNLNFEKEKFAFEKLKADKEGKKTIEIGGNLIDSQTGEIIYEGPAEAPKFAAGSIGEYQFYAQQEKDAGRTPISFNEYQNLDANRKAAIARAGVNNGKVVKIDGVDYIQQPDGSFVNPTLPTTPNAPTPAQQQKADEVIALIDQLKVDPRLPRAVGPISSRLPTLSGETADFEAKFKNLIGKITIDALPLLKGPMSDKDIAFLKEQASALSTNMSEAGFKAELDRLKEKFIAAKNGTNAQQPMNASEELKKLYTSSPEETKNKLRQIEAENPNLSDEDILRLFNPSFRSDLSTSQNGSIKFGSNLARANNNPGNLRFVGQSGAAPGSGGFARFSTPEAGIQALKNQIQLDASRGHTLQSFLSKYAPPTENDTNLYISQVEQMTGKPRGTPIKNIDLNVLARAIAKKESSSTF